MWGERNSSSIIGECEGVVPKVPLLPAYSMYTGHRAASEGKWDQG